MSQQKSSLGNRQPSDLTMQDILRILRKRRTTIVATFATCVAVAILAIFVVTTRYESVCTIEVNQSAADLSGFADIASGMMSGNGTDAYTVILDTEANVIGNDTTLLRVIKDLKLEEVDPDYQTRVHWWTMAAERAEIGKPIDQAPIRRAKLLKRFNKNLTIKEVPGTRIVEIHYDAQDPEMAAKVANHLVDVFLDEYVQSRYDATKQVGEWLSKQLQQLKGAVDESENRVGEFQREHNIAVAIAPGVQGMGANIEPDTAGNVIMLKYIQINQQLTAAEAAQMNAEAVYHLTKSGDPEVVTTLASTGLANPTINSAAAIVSQLREREAGLKSELALLQTKYDINYPRVKQLQQQIDDLAKSIQAEIAKIAARAENDLREATATGDSLRAALERQRVEAAKLNDASLQFIILSQDAAAKTALYQELSTKLQESSTVAGLESTNINVTDIARTSASPVQPNIKFYLGVGILGGLLFGCGLAFLREELDNSILTSAQVEEVTPVPVLCSIPDPRTGGKRGYGVYGYGSKDPKSWKTISVSEHPKSTFAEVYRSLRSSLLLANVGRNPQTILVTSGLPGEGKSTTSRNLAAILAQNGSRVLLVNADMRRPSLAYSSVGDSTSGLSAILSGVSENTTAMPDPLQKGLYIIGPGPHPPYPAELLGSKRAAAVIDEWRTIYDYIVFDTPPLLLLTDAVVLARHADAVILVVRYGRSTKQALRASVKILDGAHIPLTGIVINATDTSAAEYTSYYGYGYAEYGAYANTSDSSDGGKNEK